MFAVYIVELSTTPIKWMAHYYLLLLYDAVGYVLFTVLHKSKWRKHILFFGFPHARDVQRPLHIIPVNQRINYMESTSAISSLLPPSTPVVKRFSISLLETCVLNANGRWGKKNNLEILKTLIPTKDEGEKKNVSENFVMQITIVVCSPTYILYAPTSYTHTHTNMNRADMKNESKNTWMTSISTQYGQVWNVTRSVSSADNENDGNDMCVRATIHFYDPTHRCQ